MKHRDKLYHIAVSFALTIVGAFLFGLSVGVTMSLSIGAAKELIWDGVLGRGHADWWDMAANCIGVLAAVIVSGR